MKFLIFLVDRSAGRILRYFPYIVNSIDPITILNIDSGFGMATNQEKKNRNLAELVV